MEITIRVICNDLPGNASIKQQAGQSLTGQRIYLGIQKGDAVIDRDSNGRATDRWR